MKSFINRLNRDAHPFDPAAWPRAVAIVSILLILRWMTLALRILWNTGTAGPQPLQGAVGHADTYRPRAAVAAVFTDCLPQNCPPVCATASHFGTMPAQLQF